MKIVGKITDGELLKELKKDRKKGISCKKVKKGVIFDGDDFRKFLKDYPEFKEEYGYVST